MGLTIINTMHTKNTKNTTSQNYYQSTEDYNYISSDPNALIEANTQLAFLNEKVDHACLDIFERLSKVAEYRDDRTGKHTERVGILSARIAIRLGMPTDFIELICKAACLHDLGKIAVPDTLLLKPSRLTVDEYKQMQSHCEVGSDLLSNSEFPLLQMAQTIALSHHEKLDGSGYPYQLKDKEIPIEAKIVAVADVYDALSHQRPYKEAWGKQQAIDLLVSRKGIHFDADVIDAFLEVIKSNNT